ncbi:unnamed protein product [Effrenium voratum]|nr:unnamed protein product [Effrenium voratum]
MVEADGGLRLRGATSACRLDEDGLPEDLRELRDLEALEKKAIEHLERSNTELYNFLTEEEDKDFREAIAENLQVLERKHARLEKILEKILELTPNQGPVELMPAPKPAPKPTPAKALPEGLDLCEGELPPDVAPEVVERPCVWGDDSAPKAIDYSRFEAALAEESDEEEASAFPQLKEEDIQVPKEEKPPVSCQNCAKLIELKEQRRCSRCVGAIYCSRDCQKADWTFHRRNCAPASQEQRAKLAVDFHTDKLVRAAAEKEFRQIKLAQYQQATGQS